MLVALVTNTLIRIFWSLISVLINSLYLWLKCINIIYLCQKQWVVFVLQRIFQNNSNFQVCTLLSW